jgi:predicted ATPase/DNA-binding winged helix-turn-helix (wHTH) protein
MMRAVIEAVTERPAAVAGTIYRFQHFELVPLARSLSADGRPVRLSSRAFDILVHLVAHAGCAVPKERLIEHVWPSTIVEDVNLRVQMSSLRKALADGGRGTPCIERVPGEGYRFVAPVTAIAPGRDQQPLPAPAAGRIHAEESVAWLTPWARPLLGRADAIDALVRALPQRRLCTIAGPAGVGKSMVAREVAGRLASGYGARVCLVDLDAVGAACSIPQAVASALGLAWQAADGMAVLLRELRRRRTLLLLDACEARLRETAALAAQWLLQLPELWMLAASREPLGARGESLHYLAPLALPANTAGLSAQAALAHPAIALFCERARLRCSGFVLRDRDVPALVELCRRLDGLPLAIELAAARIELFSVDEILAQMDYRFNLLADGRRTGHGRHRSMWDALDWSFRRLPIQERMALRRLSVFARCFDLASAVDAVDCVFLPRQTVPQVLDSLVSKSLLMAVPARAPYPPAPRYRLLESTRAYAHAQFLASGDEARFPARWRHG